MTSYLFLALTSPMGKFALFSSPRTIRPDAELTLTALARAQARQRNRRRDRRRETPSTDIFLPQPLPGTSARPRPPSSSSTSRCPRSAATEVLRTSSGQPRSYEPSPSSSWPRFLPRGAAIYSRASSLGVNAYVVKPVNFRGLHRRGQPNLGVFLGSCSTSLPRPRRATRAPSLARPVPGFLPLARNSSISRTVATDAELVRRRPRRRMPGLLGRQRVATRGDFLAGARTPRRFDLILSDFSLPGFDGLVR